ncbi:hypothetical protein Val02_61520 [Virgisporangium aliadipatigenens]|uniref:Lasso RiPP family leader peptide-containing protein n=1 Tax=Virgisporangium aliadipatigenens TaxID=741659 RepID=A0A8J3YSZ1_9ACTN|nr:hypothetical protein [Virgisporangium aliadipatigenens]GIJ49266.1 hypothetical protein Val02_61520 [Virgisporangium aliadipatigenens]
MGARSTEKKPKDRKPYTPPRLERYGNVGVLTAGGGAAGTDFGSEISAP